MPSGCACRGPVISTGTPSMEILPASRRTAPLMIFISVDFPAPFSPSKTCTSPASSSRFTPSNAMTPGKRFADALEAQHGSWRFSGHEHRSIFQNKIRPWLSGGAHDPENVRQRWREVIDPDALGSNSRSHAHAEPKQRHVRIIVVGRAVSGACAGTLDPTRLHMIEYIATPRSIETQQSCRCRIYQERCRSPSPCAYKHP